MPSVLSDEELYLLFEYFFSKMMKYKFAPGALDKNTSEDCKFNIAVNVSLEIVRYYFLPWSDVT